MAHKGPRSLHQLIDQCIVARRWDLGIRPRKTHASNNFKAALDGVKQRLAARGEHKVCSGPILISRLGMATNRAEVGAAAYGNSALRSRHKSHQTISVPQQYDVKQNQSMKEVLLPACSRGFLGGRMEQEDIVSGSWEPTETESGGLVIHRMLGVVTYLRSATEGIFTNGRLGHG
ncbi:hypothetical protein NLU13_0378 [Sarocladium strictum]|uniref:Uncharacterized protein n=1 Tax=Sarocladium strictum TaxID=5046 RepID=A0AA39LBD5_SARSR|nr:hypothetical protein NLU13_0378 [Sarocladium strictum]